MGEFRTARGETAAPYPGIGSLSTKTFPNSSLDHKKLIHHDLKYQVVGQDVSPLPTHAAFEVTAHEDRSSGASDADDKARRKDATKMF